MDKREKPAYYYSELGRSSEQSQQQQGSHPNVPISSNKNNNFNNNTVGNKSSSSGTFANNFSTANNLINNNNNNNINSNNNSSQFAARENIDINDPQSKDNGQQAFHSNPNQKNINFQPGQPMNNEADNQSIAARNNPTQPQPRQAIITSSHSQYIGTNDGSNMMNPAKISSKPIQKVSVQNFNTGQQFQNVQPTSNYQTQHNQQQQHVFQSNQAQNQTRPLLHLKTSSMSSENQCNLTSASNTNTMIQNLDNQSSSQDELRMRRKSEPMGLTSEVEVEKIDLGLEALLMNDQSISNNPKQFIHNNPNEMNNDESMFGNQQLQNQNMITNINRNDFNNQAAYRHSQTSQQSYIGYNRSEDNIYEEIDMRRGYPADYPPIDASSIHSDDWKKNKNSKKFLGASFTRWFSTRKKSSNSQNCEEESNYNETKYNTGRPRRILLPETPPSLSTEQLKRRLIVKSIVDSENSYTSSLYRLIYEYKKPLEDSDPPVLSANKIAVIFYQLNDIMQFHRLFAIKLSHYIQEWDQNEMIGLVFSKEFSLPIVFTIYSGFINNFTNAMQTARRASSKSKAFGQFLSEKTNSSPDKLSFFGSMVKPVQRIPQLILSLNDLLKHTPFDHPDRMFLQKALTELETLADRLNERKRDAERHFAVKQLLKDHLNESKPYSQRFLIRQDDICLLEVNPTSNNVTKSKTRKIYLLNDMLICVSLPSNRLKFAVSLCDISITESVAIGNFLSNPNLKSTQDLRNASSTSPKNYSIEQMEFDHRQSLIHDLKIMMNISTLVASLRFQYNGFDPNVPQHICLGIQEEIMRKEGFQSMIDKNCLQLMIQSKNNKNNLVVQFSSPDLKKSWLVDMRLTRLALDSSNNPGWENVNENHPNQPPYIISQRIPLYVGSVALFKQERSHLTCALHYYLNQTTFIGDNPNGVLWICNVTMSASSLGALTINGADVTLIHSYELSESHVTCLELVGSTVWIGLRQGRIIVIDATSPGEWRQFASLDVQNEVRCLKHFGNLVYVGLINGVVAVFDANNYDKPYLIQLTQYPVTCLLPINDEIFACSHNKIWRIKDSTIVDTLSIPIDQSIDHNILLPEQICEEPNLLAHYGNGIWVSMIDSAIIKLFHAETLNYLSDIDIGSKIKRVLNDVDGKIKVVVTSMMATRGLLWIGTNVGMVATLSFPRLKGVPSATGSINVALHRFLGPVNILINLTAGSECIPQSPYESTKLQTKNEEVEAIYGQYADLMNVGEYISSGKLPDANKIGSESTRNISNLHVSDDSASTASSGAIYQDGLPRGMKGSQNKAVVSNSMASNNVLYQESLEQSNTNRNHFNEVDQNLGDHGSQSSRTINKIYDQAPPQVIQRNQQMINQNNVAVQEPGIISNIPTHVNQTRIYGTTPKISQCPRTVFVLAGGNGYQRMVAGRDKLYDEHAHCIIWEYKA